ncbi:MAG: nicotinate (nicotinamide) nucleotide adenylyltransferase [Clostridia bacterium]|nr:nicotinate (nicotinamide) nucleotide adenylyltransferase [Clostridia bacterium]
MKIALYGGAFNPVHNEHINIVRAAAEELELDKIIVIPTAISPHKRTSMTASGRDRLQMCRLAFSGVPNAEVSDYEIKRGGISYSYVTCRHFKKLYKDDELYFIIGADMLRIFEFWKEPEEILKCVTLAVCAREDKNALGADIKNFTKTFKKEIVAFSYVGKSVSSTRIRALAALGEDTVKYVPESVRKYIKDKNLYALPELRAVKKYLTQERWEHTVRVTEAAAEHARGAGVYEIDAITAAALHDCAKYLSENAEELSGFVPPKGVPAQVMHQFGGAYMAEKVFGIKDENILNAIRFHTTGRENMSRLEKLIFLADLLEDGRNFDGINQLRKLFMQNIDDCMFVALAHQIEYLKTVGENICPLTQRAYNYLKENYGK